MTYFDDIVAAASLPLPWTSLSNCNVLVTGASGLIGSCIIEVLMERKDKDFHVYAMGRNENRMKSLFRSYLDNPHLHLLVGDITNSLDTEVTFHYIIHAAGGASPLDFSQHPVEVMKANLIGVNNLLEYGIRHEMRRLLYISSGEVYGEGDGQIFCEDYSGYVDSTSPRSCYPSSKRAAETLCVSYSAEYGVDVVIARPCHIYGPNFTENDNRVYAQFIRNVLRGEDIVMKSSGSQFRSWCYVVDCVSALLFILFKGENRNAYNVADESANLTIKELAEMVADIADKKVVMELPSEAERIGYNVVRKSVFSTEKLFRLGWMIQGNMKQKMRKVINCRKYNF